MKRIVKYTAISISIGLCVVLLVPDLRYPAKQWLRELLQDDSGWIRTETALGDGKYELALLSPEFEIDTLFPSMTGPSDIHYFSLINNRKPALLWVTGYATKVRDAANSKNLPTDYLCHNNLDYALADYCDYWQLKDRTRTLIPRLGTITQGQQQIHFPVGFGLPMMSDHSLSTATQVLNVNEPELKTKVRHSVELNYVRDDEKTQNYKPLFQQSINVQVKVDTAAMPSNSTAGIVDCSPALPTIAFLSSRENGDLYTGHWIVREGKDTMRYDVTNMLQLPFSTTLHYAGVHVHPYCTALALIDKTTNEIVFHSAIENVPNTTKMSHIDVFSSIEGTMMYDDHKYELVCYTNNDSGKEQDMMAVMLLYLYDQELDGKLSGF